MPPDLERRKRCIDCNRPKPAVFNANLKTEKCNDICRDACSGKLLWSIVPKMDFLLFLCHRSGVDFGAETCCENDDAFARVWLERCFDAYNAGLAVSLEHILCRLWIKRMICESSKCVRDLVALIPAGYVATNQEGVIVEFNAALCDMCGYGVDEIVGRNITQFLPEYLLPWLLKVTKGTSSTHSIETFIMHKQGQAIDVLVNLAIDGACGKRSASLTAFVTDITKRKRVESRLDSVVTHDTLTGLPNREHIYTKLQSMLERVGSNDVLSVMLVDLDRFKEVNDAMGHGLGDLLLYQVARRLEGTMLPGDIVARLGGDKFVVVAHCTDGMTSAAAVAAGILAELGGAFLLQGQLVFVTASIGISMVGADTPKSALLFQNADAAMYHAKSAGRNRYRFFEEGMGVETRMRSTLYHGLRYALERQEFELHYQPRVKLATLEVVGMEALLRWNHPQLGRIAPLAFIPIAEDRGLIEKIGQWVLEEACRQAKRMSDQLGYALCVSVNLAARHLKCPDLVQHVQLALRNTQLPPASLELELTESVLIDDTDESAEVLRNLKKLGVRLSIDDFGTGYCSLSYLKRFPIDVLKLDQSFLHQLSNGVTHDEFIKALVDMGHALKLSVVAEGIETQEALALLKDCNCAEGQGYLFSEPLPVDDLERFLAAQLALQAISGTGSGQNLRLDGMTRNVLEPDAHPTEPAGVSFV